MNGLVFEKKGLSLIPVDVDGVDLLAQYPDGKRLVIAAHVPVNEKHYRLFRALASKVVKSGAWDGDRESFNDWLKMRCGHIRTVVDPETGEAFIVAKSLAIDSMTDMEFREFFDKAVQVICEKLLGRNDWKWLRDEIIAASERRNYGGGR